MALLLGRDERNLWHSYDHSLKKHPQPLKIEISKFTIPASLFKDRKLSVLETIVAYLKDEFSLSYSEISVLLKRDVRTIWTVYQRARKKNAK